MDEPVQDPGADPGDLNPTPVVAPPGPAAGAPKSDAAISQVASSATSKVVTGALASTGVGVVVAGAAGQIAGQVAGSKTGVRAVKVVAALALVVMLAVVGSVALTMQAVTAAVAGAIDEETLNPDDLPCLPPSSVALESLSAEQVANGQAIVSTTLAFDGATPQDAAIAVMTAMTESSLINVEHGDQAGPDSRGLFQQRDSWGTLEERMDPVRATQLFLERLVADGLRIYQSDPAAYPNQDETGRQGYRPWLVAQSVQISAFPDGSNYAQHFALGVAFTIAQGAPLDEEWATSWGVVTGGDGGNCAIPPDGPEESPGQWGGYSNGFIPSGATTSLSWQPAHTLRSDAARRLECLNAEYVAATGTNISVSSSYRDYQRQREMYYGSPGPRWAAFPGTSNHGWALAVDLNGTRTGGAYSAFYRWMEANGPRHGWKQPAWARTTNPGPFEPWHWEYWGGATAPCAG